MRMTGYGASGSDHDFVAYDSSGNVWDGSAFVAWVDVDFASYRIAPTVTATIGGEDRFEADAPDGTVRYELRFRGGSASASYLAWESSVWASQASVDAVAADVEGIQTTANAIKVKTDLITSGSVSVVSPTLPGGRIVVAEGFDYAADGGSAEITITEAAVGDWDDARLAADSFGFHARYDGEDDVEFTVTGVELNPADGDGLRSFTFDLLRSDVPQEGAYTYRVYGSFTATSRDVPIVKGTFRAERGRIVTA